MKRLRILLLASFCDPEAVSMPYVAYCHAAALAGIHDVSLVIGTPVEENVRRAQGHFRSIEVVRMPTLERIYAWSLRNLFKFNFASQALTAFGYPFFVAFECQAWRQLKHRIRAGEFDIVLRMLPTTAVLPSPFAFFLRKGPVPFVIGPINGGLPFVRGFKQAENQKEWISSLRGLYRFMPFARSTFRNAAAIMVASSHTYEAFSEYRDKLFFVPENGVSGAKCAGTERSSEPGRKLELIFVGGLIPCKACDLALRAAAPVLRMGSGRFTVLGDGPERARLEQLAASLGIAEVVRFCGWVSHDEVFSQLQSSDVLVFPSVRDFGAGVVYEALASGAVPIVADFGGPGDIVNREIGFKASLTSEDDFVKQMEEFLIELARDRALLERLRRQGMNYAREYLTWEAKADLVTRLLHWVLQRGPKPDLQAPTAFVSVPVSSSRQVN